MYLRRGSTEAGALAVLTLFLASACEPPDDGDVEGTSSAATSCRASDLKLTRMPLGGTNGVAWMINNYLDLDAAAAATRDYRNNTGPLARTYDGHRGIDFDLPGFRQMDDGSAVIRAVAPGRVETVVQDQFDRNTSCTGNANLVTVRHANGYAVIYMHIKRGSARVRVGQRISAGAVLAVAGSSGCSTWPHLHLEVQDCAGNAIETLLQPGMWSSPPVFDPPSNIMDVSLLAGAVPTFAQIVDPAPNATQVRPNSVLGVGVSAALRGGDTLALAVRDPAGRVTNLSQSIDGPARFGHDFRSFRVNIGAAAGTWTIDAVVNGAVKTSRTIKVTSVQPGGSEVARHAVAASQYQAVFDDLVTGGYRPVWVDGYEAGGGTFYNMVFGPVDTAWQARHAMTASTYQREFDTWVGQGYRLAHVDSYFEGGQVRYAAIFDRQGSPGWTAYHGVDQAAHQARFDDLVRQGYRPVNVSAVVAGGQRQFTALYDRANVGSFVALAGLTEGAYQAEFDANTAAGRRLAYVNAFMEGGVAKLSAIWDQRDSGGWVARHAQTSSAYQANYNNFVGQGFRTRCVAGYEASGSHRFASLWTTN